MFQLLVILGAVAVGWAYLAWSRISRFWAAKGVLHDKPHPLLGSLTFLNKQNVSIYMQQLYKRFKAPYVGIWLFWRPALVINCPNIARNILIKDNDNFRNRLLGSGSSKSDPMGGLNLFTVGDPIWTSLRRRLTPVFTSAKLRAQHNLNLTKAYELVQRIENDLKQNKKIEIRNLYTDLTTDIIGTAAFGVACDATLTGESPIKTVANDIMQFDFLRGCAMTSIFFLPEAVKIFGFTFFPKKTMAYFRKVYQSIVAQRGDYNENMPTKDLLDALLKMRHDFITTGEKMHDDLIIAQAAIFLQGGFDTTAVSLTFTTYELAFHQEVQEKLYQELLEAKEKLGDKDFDGTILSELPYLNCVIKEVLRKYSPMGWLDRIAQNEYRIDENLTIPAGTTVYVNAVGMHYDPKYYPDPEGFVPERFLPGNLDPSVPYMPFGDGPRNCIGMRFAYRTIWYTLAIILLKYKICPKPNAKKPIEIEIEKKGMFHVPEEKLYVDFIPRS